MRLFQHLLAAISLSLVALTAGAAPANPQNGVDFRTLQSPQQTDAAGKVEVTEFFWYGCPHCNTFDPALADWVRKQGDKISFRRVPVAFRDTFVPQQKMYYALEAMGKIEDVHKKIFNAIHVERQTLDTDKAITEFIARQGIDKDKFTEVYNSFGVQSKVRRASQLQSNYEIDGVPTIAINGRYLTSPSIVGASMGRQPEPVLHNATLQVMDALVARSAKEGSAQAAAKPAPAPGKAAK